MWHNSIDVLAGIHAVDWQGVGLGLLDSEANHSGLDAGLVQWRDTFEWAAQGEANPTLEAALDWLDEHRPAGPEHKVLNWGDARVGNIIFTEDLTPAAVLDWEMVNLARREQDLGWWLFLMRHHTDGVGLPLPEGIPDRDQTVAYYERITGHHVQDLHYYEVLAGTRLAILMVRAAHLLIGAGLLPPDAPMALSNPASKLVAELLGLPAPDGAVTSFIGNRGQ